MNQAMSAAINGDPSCVTAAQIDIGRDYLK
jgi:hypothetical protein